MKKILGLICTILIGFLALILSFLIFALIFGSIYPDESNPMPEWSIAINIFAPIVISVILAKLFKRHYDKAPKQKAVKYKPKQNFVHDTNFATLQAEEDKTKQQRDCFTIEDMCHFPDIPFNFSYVTQLFHTNGVAWFQLNTNNQEVAKVYISQINDIIVCAHSYVDGIENAHINLNNLDFGYPHPMRKDSVCNTRVECFPYTATGKLSRFPVVLQFATHFDKSGLRVVGSIKILQDGTIGAANVNIHGSTFKIGLHGVSLVLQRVDNPYMGGNIFKFSELYD